MGMKKAIIILVAMAAGVSAFAQGKAFELGKWTQIQSALLQELNRAYVDSLPLERMEVAGIDAMLATLDPYTVYVPEDRNDDFQLMISGTYGGIGSLIYKPDIQGNVIINEPYEGSPAARAGLRCGDEILAVDGVSTHGLTASEASDRMKGKPGTEVVFDVLKLRSRDTVKVTITRERIHLPSIAYAGMLDDGITGYLQLTGFTEGDGRQFRKEFAELKEKGMQRFVLDLRGNGGGVLQEAVKIVSTFVPKGSLVVYSKGNGLVRDERFHTDLEPVDTRMPVIVLVDSGSASASEIVSGALQDMDRATIMGTRTFGKGLVQSIRPLPYNGSLKVTTAKYYTPSGRCVQAIDYSHRNEDGSVGSIPDSLTHEFRTAHGRVVKDGGGITPDVKLDVKEYSRLTYSVVVSGIVEQYALDYVRRHESIPALEDFHYTSKDYEDFIRFASGKEFDFRSSARTYYDQMVSQLEKDGIKDQMTSELDALRKRLEMEKEEFLRLKESEIIPFIEQEIAVRYYFQEAGVQVALRYDDALRQALASPLIESWN